jgi:hypothetical protein
MKQSLAALILLVLAAFTVPAADVKDANEAKEGLKALQDFIGAWKGSGAPEKPRPTAKETWAETVNWGWRFKGDDAWLVMKVENGRYFKGGEMRFLPDKKRYQLTAKDKDDKKLVFEGELKNDYLTLQRVDPDTKETQQITMNSAAEGVRFIYRYARKADGTTLFKKEYVVACTKEGESLAAKEKKIECVVSGGLGTMPVTYKGETFYVCCSGCRDAFNENPEKYIAEFKAKKAGKK